MYIDVLLKFDSVSMPRMGYSEVKQIFLESGFKQIEFYRYRGDNEQTNVDACLAIQKVSKLRWFNEVIQDIKLINTWSEDDAMPLIK